MPQLNAYHRPTSVNEALHLLSRPHINTAIIAGGTYIVPYMNEMVNEVVDLQAVGLTEVTFTGKGLTLGAMIRLQNILADDRMPSLLRQAARRKGPNTLRHAATLGGTIAAPRKSSELLAALLVLEAEVKVQTLSDTKNIPLTEFLRDIPTALGGGIITAVSMGTMGKTASARVARTPADAPIVAALARIVDHNQIKLALCGVANTPVLVDPENVKAAINPGGNFRGSPTYRRQMAATLVQRVIAELKES